MSWAAGTPKADQPGTAGPTETKACWGSWAYTLVFPGSRKMLPCSESSLASLTRSKNSHPSPPPPGELSPGLPWPWLLAEAVPESNQPPELSLCLKASLGPGLTSRPSDPVWFFSVTLFASSSTGSKPHLPDPEFYALRRLQPTDGIFWPILTGLEPARCGGPQDYRQTEV